MLLILALLLLFVPITMQLILGRKSLLESNLAKFTTICFLSLFSQFLITFVSFFLTMNAMAAGGNKCVTGAVGIFFISFVIGLILILIMLIQFLIRKK